MVSAIGALSVTLLYWNGLGDDRGANPPWINFEAATEFEFVGSQVVLLTTD